MALITQFVGASILIQLEVPNEFRGRVVALYSLAFAGLTPFGSLAFGAPLRLITPETPSCATLQSKHRILMRYLNRARGNTIRYYTYADEDAPIGERIYPTGTTVQGWIEICFPQGVIINLGDGTLGVADDAQCRASAAPEWMASANRVTAIVSGYDEVNHWLVLDYPQVFGERIDNDLRP